ncbi:MAG: histidine phosphatase family protein [Clostridia bacterium]|nr:histidine phosphatase family protein [Clostridia bacterium]
MKTTVYFIRHGTTENNVSGRFQGSTDVPLGETGLKQATYLGERFAEVPVDAVYTSPLTRARQTAEGVCAKLELQPILYDDLREIDGGRLEGHTNPENRRDYPDVMDNFRNHPAKFCPPGGETARQVHERMTRAVNRLVQENAGKSIVIVSHGFALQSYLACLDTPFDEMEPNLVGNAAVSCLRYDEAGNFETVFYDDSSHLPEELRFRSTYLKAGRAPGTKKQG